jgi:hypothetical protein
MLRKLVPILAVLLLFAAIPAKPQTVTQQAVLSWTAASDVVASSTYNVCSPPDLSSGDPVPVVRRNFHSVPRSAPRQDAVLPRRYLALVLPERASLISKTGRTSFAATED